MTRYLSALLRSSSSIAASLPRPAAPTVSVTWVSWSPPLGSPGRRLGGEDLDPTLTAKAAVVRRKHARALLPERPESAMKRMDVAVWTTAIALLASTPAGARAQTRDVPLRGAVLIAFGPDGEDSFPDGLRASRALASRLGYNLRVIEGDPPRHILRVSEMSGEYSQNVYVRSGVTVRYILAPAGGTPETVRGAAGPLRLRWRVWLAESPEMLRYYLRLWPIALGVLFISGLAVPRAPRARSNWMRSTFWVTAAVVVGYLPLLLGFAGDPYNNVLGRDVAASVVIAVALPLLAGAIGWQLIRLDAHPTFRMLVPLCVGLALLVMSPIAILAVHCTSGDCL